MHTLALDVDGVLLDPDRGGDGHWTNELERRHGLVREQLRQAFFTRSWEDVINGRQLLEPALGAALDSIGTTITVDEVISCWFDADYVPFDDAIDLAQRAVTAGCRVVLATNQEHRRAAYLARRLGDVVRLDAVYYSADLGVQKHDPEFFEIVSGRLEVARDQRDTVVFVDDVEHNVVEARRAGWQAIHAPPGADWISEAERLLDL
ncbi:MAG: HAD family hydrolase [Ilumatobacteraceae bacterium]